MCKENTATRLRKIMEERNLRQVDILEMVKPYCQKYNVKMNRSDISQYCTGKVEPNQKKLYVLASALQVSEAWLMGFDVPQERTPFDKTNDLIRERLDAEIEGRHSHVLFAAEITEDEAKLLQYYRTSDDRGKEAINYVAEMESRLNQLNRAPIAAHNESGALTDEQQAKVKEFIDFASKDK